MQVSTSISETHVCTADRHARGSGGLQPAGRAGPLPACDGAGLGTYWASSSFSSANQFSTSTIRSVPTAGRAVMDDMKRNPRPSGVTA